MNNPFESIDKRLSNLEELVNEIKQTSNDLKQNFEPKSPPEYLTRYEVAEMLHCDLSTLHCWTKKGKLTAYGIGNRVYYKRHEIDAALIRFNK